jgi:hypothetical protein
MGCRMRFRRGESQSGRWPPWSCGVFWLVFGFDVASKFRTNLTFFCDLSLPDSDKNVYPADSLLPLQMKLFSRVTRL